MRRISICHHINELRNVINGPFFAHPIYLASFQLEHNLNGETFANVMCFRLFGGQSVDNYLVTAAKFDQSLDTSTLLS